MSKKSFKNSRNLVASSSPHPLRQSFEARRKTARNVHPAMETTVIYTPSRGVIEVFSRTTTRRPVIAEAFCRAGFNRPLSDRPLLRCRYDLTRFERPISQERPAIPDRPRDPPLVGGDERRSRPQPQHGDAAHPRTRRSS